MEDVLKIVVTALLFLIGILFIRKGMYGDEEVFCDMDSSASIEPCEAVLLGIGLSLDSLGTGIAVVALGINHVFLPVMIGLNHTLFLILGEWLGEKTMSFTGKSQKLCGVFSGVLLIVIAILHNIG